MLPAGEGHAQHLAEEKRAEAAAIDEQVAFDAPSAFQRQGRDMAGLVEMAEHRVEHDSLAAG